jgi:hypothetical protein
VPEIQDLDDIRMLSDAIVHNDRSVNQLSNAAGSRHWATGVGERPQQSNVVEERYAEALSTGRKIYPGELQDALKFG